MIGLVLLDLLKVNVAGAAAVVAVLAIRRLVRPRFGARAAYALWLAPLIAGPAMLLPHAPSAAPANPIVGSAQAAVAGVADGFVVQALVGAGPANLNVPPLLLGLWIAGALAAAGLMVRRQSRFVAAMGRLTPSDAPGVFHAQNPDVGPAVVGVWRPRIVTPADFEARFAPTERKLILAHEQAHLRTGDAAVNALACALQCAGWFNPFVHLGVRALRIDQELACDAAVIGRFPEARRVYAELLLKTQAVTQPLPLGCHWPAGADHPLKERITMLKSPLPELSTRATGLVVAGALSVGIAGLAWAAEPQTQGLEPAEAAKLVGPGQTLDCKPDANRELHNCHIKGTPFARIATAADVQREWPAEAKRRGLTAWVVLQCTPNLKTGRLDACASYHDGGAATSPALKAAFDQAAVSVASVYRLKTNPGPNDFAMRPTPGFFTIEFNDNPSLPGGPPKRVPTRFPDFLPGPGGKVVAPAAQRPAKTPVSFVTEGYTPPAGFAEPKAKDHSAQAGPLTSIWIRKPTGDDMTRLYPAEAVAKGLTGDVLMACKVGADGRLNGCIVDRADIPRGGPALAVDPGFRAATLELAKLFQMKPTNLQGAPTAGAVIHIPIRFRLPNTPTRSAN